MPVLSRKRQSLNGPPFPEFGVAIGGFRRSVTTYQLQLITRLSKLLGDGCAELLRDSDLCHQVVKTVACGRLLKSCSSDTSVFKVAEYCRCYHVCDICEYNRAKRYADLREGVIESLVGMRCVDIVVHFGNVGSESTAIQLTKLARKLSRKLRAHFKGYTNDRHRGHVVDAVIGMHVKRPPEATLQQPHIHAVLLASSDVSIRDLEGYFQRWVKHVKADLAVDEDGLAGLTIASAKFDNVGRIVGDRSAVSRTRGKAIPVVHAKNKIAYVLRLNEDDDGPNDHLGRLRLLEKASIKRTFTAFKAGTGLAEGASAFVSDWPYLIFPFAGKPRLVWPQWRDEAYAALEEQATQLIERRKAVSEKGMKDEIDSIPEDYLVPAAWSYGYAVIRCTKDTQQ